MLKGYVAFSMMAHAGLVAFVLLMGTLLAKPKMNYYSVELFSPASGGAVPTPAPSTPPPAELPKPAPVAKPVPEERAVPKEAIRVPTKGVAPERKPKKAPPPKPAPAKPKSSAAFQAAMHALESEGPATPSGSRPGLSAPGPTSSGVVGDAGPAFPYPWYLKAIAEKLDKQWHPQEYESDTVCQITFNIGRDGQVSSSAVEKASGDSVFDQLALRAVLYANPLPPLPSGFQEDTLRVHMKFVGKHP